MDRREILKKYVKQEDKLLVAKIIDKIELSQKNNKIENTDFLDLYQAKIAQNIIEIYNFDNYIFYGGQENTERKILFVYPEKFAEIDKTKIYGNTIKAIRINLPTENYGKYSHKDYLGAVIKIGIKREKVGDILVDKQGADIIVLSEIEKYILDNLKSLTRFSKSTIESISIVDLKNVIVNKKEIKIIVPSLRLDSIVAELANTSRNKASEIISQERVFINYENQTKNTKLVKEKDLITIRGKGRFEIKEILGTTKKENLIVIVEKYV